MGGGSDLLLRPPSSSKKTLEWVPLSNHPLFSAAAAATTTVPSSSSYGNLAAWDPSSSRLYVWDPRSRCLHRLLLRFPDPADSSSTSPIEAASPSDILTPDIPMRHPIRHLSVNKDGSSLLLLSAAHTLTILHLRNNDRTSCFRTATVGSEVFSGHADGIRVLHVSWHPFSETHLGVLSSDSVFRLYDLSSDLERPEQEFYLQPVEPGSSLNAVSICPVAFSFGGQHLWDGFSVFVLFSDGSIYILCPVVPFGSLCSWAYLMEIYEDVNNSSLALNWLESTFPELADQSMEGGNKVVLRAHPYAPLDASLSLKGPLCKVRNVEDTDDSTAWSADCEGKAVSFLYTSIGKDSILVIAWSSGQLQIDALADEIQPCWTMGTPPRFRVDHYGRLKGVAMICESNLEELSAAKLNHTLWNINNIADTVSLGHPPPLLRLGIVDLALPRYALDNCMLALFPDLLEPHKFYCLHGEGVDLITLHVLPFSDMMHEPENTEKAPSVCPIFSTGHGESSSTSLLPGFVAIADPYGHSQVVGITPSYECLVLEVRGQNELNPFHYDMNVKSVSPTVTAGTPEIATISKELLSGPKTSVVPLSTTLRSLTGDSIEGRSTLHHYMKMFRENYVEYAHEVYIELKHHTNYQKMVLDEQHKRLGETKQLLSNIEAKESSIQDKIDRAFKVYELLEKRLQNFKTLPRANRKPLSRAELDFKAHLETFAHVELDAIRSSIEALNARLRRRFQSPPTNKPNISKQGTGRRKQVVSDSQMQQLRSSLEMLSIVNSENIKKLKLVDHELKSQEDGN